MRGGCEGVLMVGRGRGGGGEGDGPRLLAVAALLLLEMRSLHLFHLKEEDEQNSLS